MTRQVVVGFETGDTSEVASLQTGTTIESVVFKTGGTYSLKSTAAVTGVTINPSAITSALNLSHAFSKCYFALSDVSAPAADSSYVPLHFRDTAQTVELLLVQFLQSAGSSTFVVNMFGPSGGLFGTSAPLTLAANTFYLVELDFTPGAGTGACTIYFDGTAILTRTNQAFSATNVGCALTGEMTAVAGRIMYVDDYEVDDAALCGASLVAGRSPKAGTPTYNTWTKSNGSTIDTVWSDTPFSAATFASLPLATAQTALISSFAATQTGHGTGVIASGDTINAVKAAFVAKTAGTDAAGITAIGTSQKGSSTAGANITLTFNVAPAAGDIVILYGGFGTAGASNPGPSTAGYTQIFLNTATATRRFGAWYKVMGATPDTTVIGLGSGTAGDGVAYASLVLRQTDNSVILDIAVPTAATGSSTNPAPPASGASATANALAIALAASAVSDAAIGTQLNYTQDGSINAAATRPFTIGGSHRIIAAAGTNSTPPAWSAWLTGAWVAETIMIRPALAAGSAASIRRRFNSVDTDEAITLATTDALFQTLLFTDTFANINTSEVGILHGGTSLNQTVEDVWLMVSYTPAASTPYFPQTQPDMAWLLRKSEMVGY